MRRHCSCAGADLSLAFRSPSSCRSRPGGSTDVVARIMAERMRPALGQPVVIENVGGAGGSIAVGRVARAAPDGYTIDIGQWDTHVGSVDLPPQATIWRRISSPIGLISINPQLLVAKKALPADDLKGLVAWMKANPGKATFVNQNAAAQVTGHPVAAGDRHAGALHPVSRRRPGHAGPHRRASRPARRAGRRRAAAGARRNDQGHRQPVAAALAGGAGHPDLRRGRRARTYASGWFGFFAPKGTPKDVIAKLNAAMVAGARRSGGARPLRRSRAGCRVARAADAGGARRLPQGRDRQMVADHQGRRHQGGVTPPNNAEKRKSVLRITSRGARLG